MSATVDRIFGILDEIRASVATLAANSLTQRDVQIDHESRIRGLERWQWKVVGIAMAAGAVASAVVAIFGGN